jgi:hypothetical protein
MPTLWPVALFFIPKLNLISIANETAGIRIDDFVLLFVGMLLIYRWIKQLGFNIERLPLIGFGVVAAFCMSNLINAGHSNVLYSVRLAEYLVFFWSGKALVKSGHDFTGLVKLLIGINCALILFQYAGFIGGFSADGYVSQLDRPFGLSNHPAEMGALLNLLFAALVFGTPAKLWSWSLLVVPCIFITGSRSALLTHCLLASVYVYQHSANRTKFALRTAAVAGVLVTILAIIPNPTTKRSADIFSLQNIEIFKSLYDSIPVDKTFSGFVDGGAPEDGPESVDASWYARGVKWAHVVRVMFSASWTIWIFGLGPGALGPALDGGWLRLLGETGLVGTLAFLFMMRKISSLSQSCSMVVLALAANMVMIDSHNAYRVMAFLFLFAGYTYATRLRLAASAQ